jgi:hypothetical protein
LQLKGSEQFTGPIQKIIAMKKTISTILVTVLLSTAVFSAEGFDLTRKWISLYYGIKDVTSEHPGSAQQLDFLDHIYYQDNQADYNYFEIASKLEFESKYQLETNFTLNYKLVPYNYNISFNYRLNRNLGLMVGSMSSRYYLTEFNQYYSRTNSGEVKTSPISRDWDFSMATAYLAPNFQAKYKTMELFVALQAGLGSFLPFEQQNLVKTSNTDSKVVYDYETKLSFSPFIMPTLELNFDFLNYNSAIIGGRVRVRHFITQNSINYEETSYNYNDTNFKSQSIETPTRDFMQTDIDFGFFVRW